MYNRTKPLAFRSEIEFNHSKPIKMKTLFSTLIILAICASMTAQNTTFASWDTDNDLIIEREEFTTKFIDQYFNAWDATDKRGIIEEGFFKSSYAGLDTDNDRMLSDQEWLIGYNYFYDDYVIYEDTDMVDANEDGRISYDEYYDVLYETNYFTDIDLDNDNYISEYELANYIFSNWDTNNSGTISRAEFNQFDWYYLDV
jgi:Ca2+-binding EF-hand superfamily protein